MSADISIAAAAAQYANHGLLVFPIDAPAKRPLTTHGHLDASEDPEIVTAMFRKAIATHGTKVGIGFWTGASGVVVTDTDANDAEHTLRERVGDATLAAALILKTSRGRHYYFAAPEDVPLRPITALCGVSGLDVRAGSSWAILPPSQHASGFTYSWEGRELGEVLRDLTRLVPPMPETLGTMLKEHASRNPLKDLRDTDGKTCIPEGQRNGVLWRAGREVRRHGADESAVAALINSMNIEQCRVPLPSDEVRSIVRSVMQNDPTYPITPSEWGEPVPLDTGLVAAEPFPVDVLPAWLGAYCEAWAETSQTPVDAIAVLVLGTFATAIQGRVVVRLSPDWTEQTCLFVLLVMPSGTKKSATFGAAFAPILHVERALRRDLEPQLADAENRVEIAKGRVEAARKAAQGKVTGDARYQAEQAYIDAKDELREAESRQRTLTPPLFYADDITPEAFVDLLAIHERMTIASAEGGWFGTLAGGRYSDGRANFDALLKGYSGDGIRVHRKGRDMVDIPNAICSVVVAVQPDVLREMAGTPGATERGLLARFVKAAPATRRGYRNVTDPKSMPPHVREEYATRLSIVLHALREGGPVEVSLDVEAHAMFTTLRERHEVESRPRGRVYGIGYWAEKYTGTVARIAAILHFADHTTDAAALPISGVTLARAIVIGDYFVEQELRLHTYAGQSQEAEAAQLVLDWIIGEPRETFTTRDVHAAKRGTNGLHNAGGVKHALTLLAEYRYIRPAEPDARTVGRPSETWLVNPAAYPQNPQNSSGRDSVDIVDASGEIVEAA